MSNAMPKQRENESDQAGKLQGERAEARHHVHGVADQLAHGVVGDADGALVVAHRDGDEAAGAPGKKHVDRDVGSGVVREGRAQGGCERRGRR